MPVFPSNGGSGDAITSLTGDGTATGPGAAAFALDATLATAKINVATSSLKGAQSAADKVREDLMFAVGPKQGADLGNADVTIQPFTDKCSLYIMPAATMTTPRTITIGNTSAIAGNLWTISIVREDLTSHALVINNAAGSPIFTFTGSPGQAVRCEFYCNSGVWTVNLVRYVNG